MKNPDVLVIGGGPAGSTAAAMLARDGWDVMLLERETFPRYHIGESLLPSCIATLRVSGALDRVTAAGFQIKRGGVFRWASDRWVLDWSKLVGEQAWSWQVDRAVYDEILLRNAADQGAMVIEGATVKRVVFDGDRPSHIEWTGEDGRTRTTPFSFLIDASGRAGVLSRKHFDMRIPHDLFQNVGVWGYWERARLAPDSPEGAINVVSSPEGWYWNIPLAGGRHSVGLVTPKTRFAERRGQYPSLKAYYLDVLKLPDDLSEMLAGAFMTGPVRVEQDYSYVSKRFCGPGYIIIGDAACFLDPLLSTGVHLAQYSAMVGSASVATLLRGDMTEIDSLAFFDYTYRRAYSRMLALVSAMYHQYVGMNHYFERSQELVHESSRSDAPVKAFTQIVTGLTDVDEATHADRRVATGAIVAAAESTPSTQGSALRYMGGLDMSPVWNIWRDPLGPDTAMGDIRIAVEPKLTLYNHAGAPPNGQVAH